MDRMRVNNLYRHGFQLYEEQITNLPKGALQAVSVNRIFSDF